MSSEIFLDAITAIFTDIVNSSFFTGVFPDSEKYVIAKSLSEAGKSRDEFLSHRPLYNTSFPSKVLETACLTQLKNHLSKMSALKKLQSA